MTWAIDARAKQALSATCPDHKRDRGQLCICRAVPQTPCLPLYRQAFDQPCIQPHHLSVGSQLLRGLIDACAAARSDESSVIDADNAASLDLHERFDFVRVGLMPAVAYRYGRWADSVMVQRSLGTGSTTSPRPPPLSTR